MIRQLRALLNKDLKVARRDQISTYTLLGGILVAVLARLFVPFLEDVQVTYAVAENVPSSVTATLEAHGRVELARDREAVLARVIEVDDVVGVAPGEGGLIEVIVEGDEHPTILEAPGLAIDAEAAARQGIAQVSIDERSQGSERTPLRSLILALAIYSAVVVSGAAVGLTMVDERENNTQAALRVTPAPFLHYLLSKIVLITLVAGITGPIAVWIAMGGTRVAIPWGALLLALAAIIPLSWLLGLLIGLIADTQLVAFSALKVLLVLFTSLPLLGFVDLGGFAWLLAPLAPHWGVQGMHAAITGGSMLPALWALVAVTPPLAIVIGLLARQLGLGRANRQTGGPHASS